MNEAIAASTGINVTYNEDLQKTGGYLYASPAADIGKGERSDPLKTMPIWTPGPGEYETHSDFNLNKAPKFR